MFYLKNVCPNTKEQLTHELLPDHTFKGEEFEICCPHCNGIHFFDFDELILEKPKIRYLSFNHTSIMVRVRPHKQVNFHGSQLKEALAERDRLCRIEGLNPNRKYIRRIWTESRIDKLSSDLPVGLSRAYDKNRSEDSNSYSAISVNWSNGKKSFTKRFFYNRNVTEEEAIKKALAFREGKVKLLKDEIEKDKEFVRRRGFKAPANT